ncbi:MAG: hypothetical protein ABIH04_11715 [Planctomycetota bacterium]
MSEAEAKPAREAAGLRKFLWAVFALCVLVAAVLLAMPDSPEGLAEWNALVLGYGVLKFAAIVVFAIVALIALFLVLTRDANRLRRRARRTLAIGLGVVLCIVVFDVMAATFPIIQVLYVSPEDVLPFGTWMCEEDEELGFKFRPNISWEYHFDPANKGDLLVWEEMLNVVPVTDEAFEDKFSTDSEGFYNKEDLEHADVVVLGDSFVGAASVPYDVMWPRQLGANLGRPTANLGMPFYSTTQELAVLRRYGLKKKPKVVVWAYFEGNDIWESARHREYQASGMGWVDFQSGYAKPAHYKRPIVRLLIALAGAQRRNQRPRDEFNPVRYKVEGEEKLNAVAIVFSYTRRLALSREELEKEKGYGPTIEAIREAKRLCDENDIEFLLVYIPAKAHAYWPLIRDKIEIDALEFYRYLHQYAGGETREKADEFFKSINENMNAQRDLIKELLPEKNFLDLTGPFQEKIIAGERLYYAYDTHFSQAGHGLCAEIVARRIREEGLIK